MCAKEIVCGKKKFGKIENFDRKPTSNGRTHFNSAKYLVQIANESNENGKEVTLKADNASSARCYRTNSFGEGFLQCFKRTHHLQYNQQNCMCIL